MIAIRKRFRRIRAFLATHPKVRRIIAGLSVLLVLAMICLLVIFCRQKYFENEVYALQKQATEQIHKKGAATAAAVVDADYSAEDVHTLVPADLDKVSAQQQINDYGVGLIDIPSISMRLPILEGITQANLTVGAGTAKPDQQLGKGNFVLLGHYMTNRGLLFGGIRYVKKGDAIHVNYYDQAAQYEVTNIEIVSMQNIEYMEDPKDDSKMLTLITCDSSQTNTNRRLVVQAKLAN